MNETIKHQLNHRTIRFFKQDQPVEEETLQTILEVFNRTATSNGMQTASLVRITDQAKRDAIAQVGNQTYISEAPELFIFLVDSYRLTQIAINVNLKMYTFDDIKMYNFAMTHHNISIQ